jgi:hypothetical protein
MADRLAEDGFAKAGYNVVGIDDCWLAKERDQAGRLQPDSARFPSGLKALGDYIHARYPIPLPKFFSPTFLDAAHSNVLRLCSDSPQIGHSKSDKPSK